jgi:hypothetical protein
LPPSYKTEELPMKRSVFGFLLVLAISTVVSAEMPARKPLDQGAWRVYSRNLLVKLFPANEAKIDKIVFVFKQDGEINAHSSYETNTITIHSGILGFVKSEDEFAMVLGHEYAHILLKHFARFKAVVWFSQELDVEATTEQEMAADQTAREATTRAGFNPCASYTLNRHLSEYYADPTGSDPLYLMGLERVRAAKLFCENSSKKL